MNCPECGGLLYKKRNYSPSIGYQPGHTFTHIYTLSEMLKNPGLCKFTSNTHEKRSIE